MGHNQSSTFVYRDEESGIEMEIDRLSRSNVIDERPRGRALTALTEEGPEDSPEDSTGKSTPKSRPNSTIRPVSSDAAPSLPALPFEPQPERTPEDTTGARLRAPTIPSTIITPVTPITSVERADPIYRAPLVICAPAAKRELTTISALDPERVLQERAEVEAALPRTPSGSRVLGPEEGGPSERPKRTLTMGERLESIRAVTKSMSMNKLGMFDGPAEEAGEGGRKQKRKEKKEKKPRRPPAKVGGFRWWFCCCARKEDDEHWRG